MAKSDTTEPPSVTPLTSWGTWEELLLASAVNRYGVNSWDSISSELRKRTPICITSHHCEQKYTELKRRFNHSDNAVSDSVNDSVTIPWLDDLRKQRVDELQKELQNYEIYIESLQLKVKKLTEESEKKSDSGNAVDGIETEKKEPEIAAVSGEVSGDVAGDGNDSEENQSVNGSNGNLEKSENDNGNDDGNGNGNGNDNDDDEENGVSTSPVRTGEEKVEILTPVREEDSCNGRPESVSEPVKSEPDGGDSVKSEGKNSDVQSSASKSKKERIDRVRRGSMKTGGGDNEDQSTDSIPVRSLPLVDFLNKLHKLGSALFDRRLDRQEKLRYKNLIRQHIDYEILQTRLKEGWYSDGNDKFFRDLLLLVNNTRIFYPKESLESTAAVDIRQVILKEMMSKKKQKNELKSNEKQSSSKPANLPPKRASEPSDSLLLKPKLAGPIVVCRKRSSITAKAAGSSSGADRRKEQADFKNSEKLIEEIQDTPKRSRDGFSLMTKKKGKSVEKNPDHGKTPESSDAKSDKKKKLTDAEEKKQSAAKFLNRMKRTSNNESLLNTLKSSSERGGGSENDSKGGGGEQKKSSGGGSGSKSGGGDGKKDQASKKSSGGRQVKEQGSPAKRSVGRPPKRAAAPPPMLGKRNRESTESETLGTKQTKKRSKRCL